MILHFPTDAYPVDQVDYSWKPSKSNVIDVIGGETNEFTLADIKTKRKIVEYGTGK